MFLAPGGAGCWWMRTIPQIELRLLAHIAGDEAMQEGFRTGADIHAITASQVFGVPLEQVTKQMRSAAKAVNFGIVYGISGIFPGRGYWGLSPRRQGVYDPLL